MPSFSLFFANDTLYKSNFYVIMLEVGSKHALNVRQNMLSELVKPKKTGEKKSAGINGFGRVGLRLFRHWLKNSKEAAFAITHINDVRGVEEIAQEIKRDSVLGEIPNDVVVKGSTIVIDGTHTVLVSSHADILDIPWHGDVDFLFECSGKFTKKTLDERVLAARHLRGKVKKVIISATSIDADHMIVLGVNHEDYKPESHNVISYGSCTVNAYTPVAKILNDEFGVADASVHVTHGLPEKEIQKLGPIAPIEPRDCTLEYAGPHLLPFLKSADFYVTYHLVPTPTASLMEMQFMFKKPASKEDVLKCLERAAESDLDLHLAIARGKQSSNEFIASANSIVIDADSIRTVGKKTLMRGWFDNEHSILRAYDLAHFMLGKDGSF